MHLDDKLTLAGVTEEQVVEDARGALADNHATAELVAAAAAADERRLIGVGDEDDRQIEWHLAGLSLKRLVEPELPRGLRQRQLSALPSAAARILLTTIGILAALVGVVVLADVVLRGDAPGFVAAVAGAARGAARALARWAGLTDAGAVPAAAEGLIFAVLIIVPGAIARILVPRRSLTNYEWELLARRTVRAEDADRDQLSPPSTCEIH